jgi:hypothetical protein
MNCRSSANKKILGTFKSFFTCYSPYHLITGTVGGFSLTKKRKKKKKREGGHMSGNEQKVVLESHCLLFL